MSRRRAAEKREVLPDAKYHDIVLSKFMNTLMERGKKSVAERVVYGALDGVFQKALLHYLSGDEDAPARLGEQARGALPVFVAAG